MVLYPNKLPESERVCSGICTLPIYIFPFTFIFERKVTFFQVKYDTIAYPKYFL